MFSFRRILAWAVLGRFCLPERQSLARGVEAAEPIFHVVDFVADPLVHALEPEAVGREAVQMVEDANEGMRRRRLAGVDLGTDEIERPLEPRDLKEREVVCGIGVAPIKLLADDLLDTTEAEVFRSRDGSASARPSCTRRYRRLGHRLVHLIDRKFVGDELFQRIGCLELVQKTQAARVAGRGMVGHAEEADLVGQQMPAPIDRDVADIGEHARDAPTRWRGIMLLAEICILSPVLAVMP